MKRLLFAAAIGFAVLTGTARADTWTVVPSETQSTLAQPGDDAQLLPIWQGAGTAYGIPWQVLAAINRIESDDGRNMGTSSAGAVGWMQFMPSTWLEWGVDANGDGTADPWNAEDAIYSAARYLSAVGGQQDLPRAIFAYNHADWYVQRVLELANRFGAATGGASLGLDRLQASLAEAQSAVADANARLVAAQEDAGSVTSQRDALLERADSIPLFTGRLEFQRRAILADGDASDAEARVGSAERELAAAEARLEQVRAQRLDASFAPSAVFAIVGESGPVFGFTLNP